MKVAVRDKPCTLERTEIIHLAHWTTPEELIHRAVQIKCGCSVETELLQRTKMEAARLLN